MAAADIAATRSASLAEFDRTTSRWGQLTMGAALLLSLAAPIYLVLGAWVGSGLMVRWF